MKDLGVVRPPSSWRRAAVRARCGVRGRVLRRVTGRGIFLRASPIDVSTIVRELLLDRMHATVLTSATLTVDGTFDYIRDRLGIRHADEVRLASEFDFTRQAILYLPLKMPDPRSDNFTLAAGREVIEILKRTQGRAFVLLELRGMRAVLAFAKWRSTTHRAQGTAPRSQREQFRPHIIGLLQSRLWLAWTGRRSAQLCHRRQLPLASPVIRHRRSDRPTRAWRRPVQRLPGPVGDSGASAGAGPPHPSSPGSRRPGRAGSTPADQRVRAALHFVVTSGAGRTRPVTSRGLFFALTPSESPFLASIIP